MTVWLDAHLSPVLAPWLSATFGVAAAAVRDLGLRDALDPPIFDAARTAGAVVMTKDADFAEMVTRRGPPPQVIWLRCGNTSNAALRVMLAAEFPAALTQLAAGAPLVEVGVTPP
jgi:predicted nuclease of predicted toxin-antitoxin system